MSSNTDYFNLNCLRRPIAFIGCESLYPALHSVLRDWQLQPIHPNAALKPVITMKKSENGFERTSNWANEPRIFSDPVDAVCDLIVDLIHALVEDNTRMLCLHCAAVDFGGGLVVFPATYRSGKSLLSVKLASQGARLFSDDVLPVTDLRGSGMALGILPRLRLPLPGQGNGLSAFVNRRIGPQNGRYRYINLNHDEQAPFGTELPVRAIVLLDRRPDNKPALRKVDRSDVVKQMILRNFARQNPALEIVDRIYAITLKADCYGLRYNSLEQAVKLLKEVMGSNDD